jgi:hypothetical protein
MGWQFVTQIGIYLKMPVFWDIAPCSLVETLSTSARLHSAISISMQYTHFNVFIADVYIYCLLLFALTTV